MKISYNWLKSYLNIDYSPNKISAFLTDTGLEVEGVEIVESIKGGLKGVVIGEVLSKTPHENADKLNVTTVNVGEETPLQIVCGAKNVEVGQKVVVAKVGAILYPTPADLFEIKKAKIRGVDSFGMICAEDELGLGSSHDGIMVLPSDSKIGMQASEFFKLENDYLIEIGLTPNRTDALGHIGVARDLKAALNIVENKSLSLILPPVYSDIIPPSKHISLTVEDVEACPFYAGVVVKNIKNLESPNWLKNRLNVIGQKSINALVDITNYVMFETGQPLHAFDLAKVGSTIQVRKAKENEKIVTLDETTRTLNQQDLLICNARESMCIAGVFGGKDSGVSGNTTDIFLEAAYFNPVSVRKTAKRHGLNTDSSFRFERGVDPQKVEFAMKRALFLILEICAGDVEGKVEQGLIPAAVNLNFSIKNCQKLIGENIDPAKIIRILEELEFKVRKESEDVLSLTVPSYRVDVTREVDVIEEVLRIHGFNNVPIPTKLNASLSSRPKPDKEKIYAVVADFLVSNGFFEIMNNSLTAYKDTTDVVELLNPLSQELKHMRKELISGGLKSVVHNQNRQFADCKLFEFGKTYELINEQYIETEKLMLLASGESLEENWNSPKFKVDFFEIKGIVEAMLIRLGLDKIKYDYTESGKIELKSGKIKIGELGEISPAIRKEFGIKNAVFFADLDWIKMVELTSKSSTKASVLPKTQFVRRDFSLLLNESVKFEEIRKIANGVNNNLLQKVGLFDVYEGKNLPQGKKSYAVSFIFQDQEKTLKDDLIDGIMLKIRTKLETELKAELR